MESLEIKNAKFTQTGITLLKRKKEVFIPIEIIDSLDYTKFNFFNLLCDTGYPGYLRINLIEKIDNVKTYLIRVKYSDFKKLPDKYKELLIPIIQ